MSARCQVPNEGQVEDFHQHQRVERNGAAKVHRIVSVNAMVIHAGHAATIQDWVMIPLLCISHFDIFGSSQ